MGCSGSSQPSDNAELLASIESLRTEVSELRNSVDEMQNTIDRIERNADIKEKDWVQGLSGLDEKMMLDLELAATGYLVERLDYGVQVSSGSGMVGCTSHAEIDNIELKEVYFGYKRDDISQVNKDSLGEIPVNLMTFIYTFDGSFTGECGGSCTGGDYKDCAIAVEIPYIYYSGDSVAFGEAYVSSCYTTLENVKELNLLATMDYIYNNERFK